MLNNKERLIAVQSWVPSSPRLGSTRWGVSVDLLTTSFAIDFPCLMCDTTSFRPPGSEPVTFNEGSLLQKMVSTYPIIMQSYGHSTYAVQLSIPSLDGASEIAF